MEPPQTAAFPVQQRPMTRHGLLVKPLLATVKLVPRDPRLLEQLARLLVNALQDIMEHQVHVLHVQQITIDPHGPLV